MENKYLKELYESCQKLATTNQFNHNKSNVFSLVTPIINAFNNLKENTDNEELINRATSIIIDVKDANPQLKGIVDAIIEIINESYKETEITIRR